MGTTADHLLGETQQAGLHKYPKMLHRLESNAGIPDAKKTKLLNVMDAYLRDYKMAQTYTS